MIYLYKKTRKKPSQWADLPDCLEDAEHGHIGLAGTGGGAHQQVLVGPVGGVADNRLDPVEAFGVGEGCATHHVEAGNRQGWWSPRISFFLLFHSRKLPVEDYTRKKFERFEKKLKAKKTQAEKNSSKLFENSIICQLE